MMNKAVDSEKPITQPPLIPKPITDNVSSTASLAYHTLRSLDLTKETTTISTASLKLLLSTFIQMIEARNADRFKPANDGRR